MNAPIWPQRQRDILRGNRADALVGLGEMLAHGPEVLRLRLGLCDQPVADQPGLEPFGKDRFQRVLRGLIAAKAQFDQNHPVGGRVPRLADVGEFLAQEAEAGARQEFKGADPVAHMTARKGQQVQRRLGGGHGQQRGARGGGAGRQLQRGGGDHAQRALGPDQKVAQVVAGIVLAQAFQPVPDLAVRQHRFQPQHLIAGIAVAQRVHAARIGGQQAADPRRAFGGERKRKEPVGLGRGGVHIGKDRACLDNGGVFLGVDGPDRRHALQRQDQVRRGGHLTGDQSRAAAIGDEAHPTGIAGADDLRDLVSRPGQGDPLRRAVPFATRFLGIAGLRPADRIGGQVARKRVGKGIVSGVHGGPPMRVLTTGEPER